MRQEDASRIVLTTLGGAFLGVALTLSLTASSGPVSAAGGLGIVVLAVFGTCLLTTGFWGLRELFCRIRILSRDRKTVLRIGILNDFPGGFRPDLHSWSYRSADSWKALIQSRWDQEARGEWKRVKIKLIAARKAQKLHSYHAILNPYGGAYPEYRFEALEELSGSTLGAIIDYVRRGGGYLNVADVPSYWAFDVVANRRLCTSPLTYERGRPVRRLRSAALMRRLGITVYWPHGGAISPWAPVKLESRYKRVIGLKSLEEVERVAACDEPVVEGEEEVLKPVISCTRVGHRGDHEHTATPFFRVSFGRGFFLFSLTRLADHKGKPVNSCLETLIVDVLLVELELREKTRRQRGPTKPAQPSPGGACPA